MTRKLIFSLTSTLGAVALAIVLTAVGAGSASSDPLNLRCDRTADRSAASFEMIVAQATLRGTEEEDEAPSSFKAPEGDQRPTAALIKKGDCCGPVLGDCATICDKEGGCTGVGDCITNPN